MRQPLLDPGMEKMLELDKRIHLIARLPPPQELANAFKDFVAAKTNKSQPIEDFHAVQLLQTLESLETRNVDGESAWLEAGVINGALRVIADSSSKLTPVHNKLARALFQALVNRNKLDVSENGNARQKILARYIWVLCGTGDSKAARDALETYGDPERKNKLGPWSRILYGFSSERNEEELLKTIQKMEERGIDFSAGVYRIMTLHYARMDNTSGVKRWFRSAVFLPHEEKQSGLRPDDDTYRELLEFCLRNDEMDWGQSVLESGGGKTSEQHTWDAIFRAAAATGRSVDEVDRMINVMVRRAEEDGKPSAKPNIQTFNGLIRFAVSRNDAYTAERYFSLAEKWGVAPDAQTYILQVEYRLAAGDVEGAQSAYSKLRQESDRGNEDWLVMNQLLGILTTKSDVKNETVLNMIDDISEKRKVFPADTVLALCTYHLNRDEYFELVDLLQTYAYQYSISDRLRIRDVLVNFALSPTTDTGRAWDTYMIFHQVFDLETRRDVRNRVMTDFFDRGRPDLATHVFTRMSKHVRADTRPDVDTYVRAFEGIAVTQETEALEVVHNLLKLDTETEPCTRLYNSLMMAYTACDAPWRAMEFWEQIATSEEGPSYESLHIAFRACEKAPFGYRRAKAIWAKLRQTDVEISRELFASYVGSLAGQQLFDDLVTEIKGMNRVVMGGEGADVFT